MTIQHIETHDGFTIVLHALDDDQTIAQLYSDAEMSVQQIRGIQRSVDNGTMVHFVARVVAVKNGIELGDDYLGGCVYKTYDDFVKNSGYYEDMRSTAIDVARTTIKALNEGL